MQGSFDMQAGVSFENRVLYLKALPFPYYLLILPLKYKDLIYVVNFIKFPRGRHGARILQLFRTIEPVNGPYLQAGDRGTLSVQRVDPVPVAAFFLPACCLARWTTTAEPPETGSQIRSKHLRASNFLCRGVCPNLLSPHI